MSDDFELAMQRRQRQTDGLALFTTHPEPISGESQAGKILRHLKDVGPLTSLDALTLFGCSRLAARVADLRMAGHPITSEMVSVGNNKRVSQYSYTWGTL